MSLLSKGLHGLRNSRHISMTEQHLLLGMLHGILVRTPLCQLLLKLYGLQVPCRQVSTRQTGLVLVLLTVWVTVWVKISSFHTVLLSRLGLSHIRARDDSARRSTSTSAPVAVLHTRLCSP